MLSAADYLALVTSEHVQRPNFRAVIEALTSGPADISNVISSLPLKFDLDVAVGAQLDAVGEWVGISRRVPIPLVGVYFEWDTVAELGWDLGNWQGPDDPSTGLVSLDDDSYRILIRAKIATNQWDGTVPSAIEAYLLVFPEQDVVIQDNQDMTMDVVFIGPPLTAVERALILGDYLVLRPSTVQQHTYSVRPVVDPEIVFEWDTDAEHGWDSDAEWLPEFGSLFAWDSESDYLSGWGIAGWVGPLLSTA
jgi:hypothetical protein